MTKTSKPSSQAARVLTSATQEDPQNFFPLLRNSRPTTDRSPPSNI